MCNYVNCLWLFIQLFTLVFAHAFICHIRGWQWWPESGRLSPQALWTDNRHRENPPLQSCAASWPTHNTIWREIALKRPGWSCTPAHNKEHTHVQACAHTLDLIHTNTVQCMITFLFAALSHTHWAAVLSYKCSFRFMFQIFSANATETTL